MAIYHLHAKVVQRSKGENVIAASAYRRAAKLRDHKEEKNFDFTAKKDVIYSDLMVPEDAPAWVKELSELHEKNPSQAAEQLWNVLNAAEKRKDAQLGREIEFALPIELNETQSIQLASEFIRDQWVSRGMIADWSVHWDTGNPHVHVLLTMRVLTEDGFGRRAIEWNQKALLQTWREQWAEYANYHLHLHQHHVRIDHRSYEAQGIDLIPGIHQGGGARAKAGRGETMDRVEEANAIRRLNLARLGENAEIVFRQLSSLGDTFTDGEVAKILGRYVDTTGSFSQPQNPIGSDTLKNQTLLEAALENTDALTPDAIERILNIISTHESVFTEKDIAKAVEHFSEEADAFAKIVTAIKQSPNVIALGKGEDGRERFTTQPLFDAENMIQQLADHLKDRWHRHLPEYQKQAILAKHQAQTGKSLTDEQKTAINHILKPHAIACIVGRAGTGKSFCLGAAKALWESQNVSVYGIALSGIAADGLSKDTGLPSTTIASFCYRVENQLLTLKPHDVVVMDEAGQAVEAETLIALQTNPKKCLLVGDTKQLPATVISKLAEKQKFDRSMLWRLLEDCQQPHGFLQEQYRMHPEISVWPSKRYYNGRLVNAPNVSDPTHQLANLKDAPAFLGPYAFIHVEGYEAFGKEGRSLWNVAEQNAIVNLVQCLHKRYHIDVEKQVGIISFYKAQVEKISDALHRFYPKLVVQTVDGFQGGENDIIIISFVRANAKGNVGFLSDFRRLNVAITRARFSLLIVGHSETLANNEKDVELLIQDAKERQKIFAYTDIAPALKIKRAVKQPHPRVHKKPAKNEKHVQKETPHSPGKSSLAYEKNRCYFFNGTLGSCKRGDECTFSHDVQSTVKHRPNTQDTVQPQPSAVSNSTSTVDPNSTRNPEKRYERKVPYSSNRALFKSNVPTASPLLVKTKFHQAESSSSLEPKQQVTREKQGNRREKKWTEKSSAKPTQSVNMTSHSQGLFTPLLPNSQSSTTATKDRPILQGKNTAPLSKSGTQGAVYRFEKS